MTHWASFLVSLLHWSLVRAQWEDHLLGTCFIALVVKNYGKWTNVWEELIYFVSQILPSAGLLILGIKISTARQCSDPIHSTNTLESCCGVLRRHRVQWRFWLIWSAYSESVQLSGEGRHMGKQLRQCKHWLEMHTPHSGEAGTSSWRRWHVV